MFPTPAHFVLPREKSGSDLVNSTDLPSALGSGLGLLGRGLNGFTWLLLILSGSFVKLLGCQSPDLKVIKRCVNLWGQVIGVRGHQPN